SLLTPSSAARALANGAPNIERVDRLVQTIAAGKGKRLKAVDDTVALVDGWGAENRAEAARHAAGRSANAGSAVAPSWSARRGPSPSGGIGPLFAARCSWISAKSSGCQS